MTTQDHVRYHSKRAMTELDLSLRAGTVAAARAHARLSALHLDRARTLGAAPPELASNLPHPA